MSNHSIVEYLGGSNDGKCGYCKQTGNYNSHGFWAHTMNVFDYQALINRNWRRSGQYCYIPKNKGTCCPMYTIKCDATNFKLTRSHKKILKRMNKYLRDGAKEKNYNRSFDMSTSNEPVPSKAHSKIQIDNINASSIEPKANAEKMMSSKKQNSGDDEIAKKTMCNLGKKFTNPKKKKFIRLEKKKAKLDAKGLSLNDIKRKRVNIVKSLEDYLKEEPTGGKHNLKVKLVKSTEGSTISILELFQKYQSKIHNDPIEKNTKRSYDRFLVNSPLQTKLVSVSAAEGSNIKESFNLFCKYESTIHKSSDNQFSDYKQFLVTSPLKLVKNNETPPDGFGSFHYQYYLDEVLIAVGVIDILPECISSVYFYYNPDYNFLSLGTYASLREIALVRQLSQTCSRLSNYYLGFYIPTCPKMRYKSNVKPSYLLCPEVFSWHLLDESLSHEIDAVQYYRINKNEEDHDKVQKEDIQNILVLFNRTAMKYGDFKRQLMKSRKFNDDTDEVLEYASKVGKTLCQKILLYRS